MVKRLGCSGTKSEERQRFGDFDRHLLGPLLYDSWGGDDGAEKKVSLQGARRGPSGQVRATTTKNGRNDGPRYTLGAGVLLALNNNTSDVTLKWALSVEC